MIERFDTRCAPPRWARGGHAQTLLGYFLPCPGEALLASEEGVRMRLLDLEDGDRVAVLDAPPRSAPGFAPGARPLDGVVVHLFHGLTGSSDSNYVRLVGEVARRAGARVVAFNHRDQGPGEGLARRIYHSGSVADAFASIARSRTEFPDHLHLAVGFSLSGNIVLLGAGRDRDHPGAPDAVLAVNPPVDLGRCARRIESGVNRLYDRNFVKGMRLSLQRRIERGEIDARFTVLRGWSVRQADHAVTAPLAGFSTGDEYYERCSAGPWLSSIRVPTVVLTSADDPFIHPSDIEDAARDSSVFVHVEETGGHLGYIGSNPGPSSRAGTGPASVAGRRWLGRATLHYQAELVRVAALTRRPDAPRGCG
ncbi:MAG: alpha/beta fold hydrolase [Planctomycetota bacterium]